MELDYGGYDGFIEAGDWVALIERDASKARELLRGYTGRVLLKVAVSASTGDRDAKVTLKAPPGGRLWTQEPTKGIYVNDEDVLERMSMVEGVDYVRAPYNHQGSECSFDAALKTWLSLPRKERSDDVKFTIGHSVYGAGGWNRYFLKVDGELIFSKGHAGMETIEHAKEVGFRTW